MTRTWFFFILLLCCPCFAQQKPTLYIFHASWCPPCITFDRTFEKNEDFRTALQRAANLRSLDWENAADKAYAERTLKVDDVPSYVLVRNGRIVAKHVGFTCDPKAVDAAISDLMQSLNIEWPPARSEVKPRPDPPRVPTVKAPEPLVDREARDAITKLATQSRGLAATQEQTQDRVEAIAADVQKIRSDVSEATTGLRSQIESGSRASRTQLETISQTLQKSIESTRESSREELQTIIRDRLAIDGTRSQASPNTGPAAAPISTEILSEPLAPGPTASKWLQVLAWAGKTGLAIVAPEVFIPGSIGLTAAGLALRVFMKRRQPKPLGTAENPIRVTEPNEVRTETKYVVSETDVYGEAYKEAIRRVGNAHRETAPHVIDVLKQVDAAATQLAHGTRIARRPSTAPVSENEP